jgi:hypothetical protein
MLLGGYLGEHLGLRYALAAGGVGALTLAAWAWRHPVIRNVRTLPKLPVLGGHGAVDQAAR